MYRKIEAGGEQSDPRLSDVEPAGSSLREILERTNLQGAFGQRFNEGTSIALGKDSVIKDYDNASV